MNKQKFEKLFGVQPVKCQYNIWYRCTVCGKPKIMEFAERYCLGDFISGSKRIRKWNIRRKKAMRLPLTHPSWWNWVTEKRKENENAE